MTNQEGTCGFYLFQWVCILYAFIQIPNYISIKLLEMVCNAYIINMIIFLLGHVGLQLKSSIQVL